MITVIVLEVSFYFYVHTKSTYVCINCLCEVSFNIKKSIYNNDEISYVLILNVI